MRKIEIKKAEMLAIISLGLGIIFGGVFVYLISNPPSPEKPAFSDNCEGLLAFGAETTNSSQLLFVVEQYQICDWNCSLNQTYVYCDFVKRKELSEKKIQKP